MAGRRSRDGFLPIKINTAEQPGEGWRETCYYRKKAVTLDLYQKCVKLDVEASTEIQAG
jgi:hypothetical protein